MTTAQLLEDEAKVFADFPTESITVGGTAYDCLVLTFTQSKSLEDGGFMEQPQLVVAIERGAFGVVALPEKGDAVVFRTLKFRVFESQEDDTAASVRVSCRRDVDGR